MRPRGPIPPEHLQIARGSGAAAILMFLHIAVIGYLGFAVYYILRHRYEVIWSLTQPAAALLYWLPGGFALFTFLPTDPLTRKVGRAAQIAGAVALVTFFGCMIALYATGHHKGVAPWPKAAATLAVGAIAAVLLRLVFAAITAPARENYKKNTPENEVPE